MERKMHLLPTQIFHTELTCYLCENGANVWMKSESVCISIKNIRIPHGFVAFFPLCVCVVKQAVHLNNYFVDSLLPESIHDEEVQSFAFDLINFTTWAVDLARVPHTHASTYIFRNCALLFGLACDFAIKSKQYGRMGIKIEGSGNQLRWAIV